MPTCQGAAHHTVAVCLESGKTAELYATGKMLTRAWKRQHSRMVHALASKPPHTRTVLAS